MPHLTHQERSLYNGLLMSVENLDYWTRAAVHHNWACGSLLIDALANLRLALRQQSNRILGRDDRPNQVR
jgi:hypothetical protein